MSGSQSVRKTRLRDALCLKECRMWTEAEMELASMLGGSLLRLEAMHLD